jgi:hypothetical protein
MFRKLNFASTTLTMVLILSLSVLALAQSRSRSPRGVNRQEERSSQAAAQLSLASFSAKGLNYETELTGLYLGDFAHARLERDSIEFDTLFGSYLTAFARHCEAYLPANRVEITESVCAETETPVNIYGAPVGSSSCVRYRQQGTGLYADPDLYSAQRQVDAEAGRNMVRDTFSGMAGNNPMGTAMHTLDAATSVGNDMDSLLRMNTCASPGLKRFQDNMMRFALGQQPLRLAGGETLASIRPKTSPGVPFKDSNYTKLLDDLVTENSQAWMMNRYVRGSVSGVAVSSRDELGRPSKILGDYLFDGFNGRSKGSVMVQFADGLPQCIYFSDFPTTCRSPSRRIITAYENGRYQE